MKALIVEHTHQVQQHAGPIGLVPVAPPALRELQYVWAVRGLVLHTLADCFANPVFGPELVETSLRRPQLDTQFSRAALFCNGAPLP